MHLALLLISFLYIPTNAILTQTQRIYIPNTDIGGAENLVVVPSSQRIFTADGSLVAINVISLQTSSFETRILVDPLFPTTIDDVPSVAYIPSSNLVVASAIPSNYAASPGYLVAIDADTLSVVGTLTLTGCFLPDHIAVSPDNNYLIIACEGEPDDNEIPNPSLNPVGSVAVVDISSGSLSKWFISVAGFEKYNNDQALLDQLYLPYINEPFSVNVEPEYSAVSSDSLYAYVTLQEQNAVAVLDIKNVEIIDIFPLGVRDLSVTGLDASNRDNAINIRIYPNLFAMRQPDAIEYVTIDDKEYIITANEGDTKSFDESRVKDLVLSSNTFNNISQLQREELLGRLKVSNLLGQNAQGEYEQLFAFSSRDVTIFEIIFNNNDVPKALQLVYDSESLFEDTEAVELGIDGFNSDYFNPSFDDRSDDKGPEPESVVFGTCNNGRVYAFAAMERTAGIFVFDVTDIEDGSVDFVEYSNNQDFSVTFEEDTRPPESAGDIGPEQMRFVPQNALDKYAYLAVAYSESSSVTLYRVDCGKDSSDSSSSDDSVSGEDAVQMSERTDDGKVKPVHETYVIELDTSVVILLAAVVCVICLCIVLALYVNTISETKYYHL